MSGPAGPWIGVDLDGTWVRGDEPWQGPTHVGTPIPAMTAKVRCWLAAGWRVKVFTARYAIPEPLRSEVVRAIQDFTEAEVGRRLEVTNEKDFDMVECWDDRAVRVVDNTGEPCCRRR